MRSPTMGDTRAFRLYGDCALQRAGLKPARRCPWSADAAWKPTSSRGSQAPRGDGRRVRRDRHLRAFSRDLDARAPR